MDPNRTWDIYAQSIEVGDLDTAWEAAASLTVWVATGGMPPDPLADFGRAGAIEFLTIQIGMINLWSKQRVQ